MTVSTTNVSVSYAGNGSTTAFPITFQFGASADLSVVLVNDSTGEETAQSLTTHYTVSQSASGTGTLTTLTAPASGYTLRIDRLTAKTQPSSLRNQGSYYPETVEQMFDRGVRQTQEVNAAVVAEVAARAAADSSEAAARADGDADLDARKVEAPYVLEQIQAAVANPNTSLYMQTGSGSVARTIVDKARERLSPEDKGAVGDDATVDTVAMQAAHDQAGAVTFQGGKTYLLQAGAVSPYKYANTATVNAYRAVALTRSNVWFEGNGAAAHIKAQASPASSDVEFAFATNKNTTLGTLTNLTWSGVTFDVKHDGAATTNYRALHPIGVDGVRLLGTHVLSSGARVGYGGDFHNCENVQIVGHMHRTVTGGLNFRFVDGVTISGSMFDDFSEALDFDGTAHRGALSGLVFRSGGAGQCIDLNSAVDFIVDGVVVNGVGNFATINYKDTTQPNYSDYVNNVTPSSLTPSERVTIANVSGSDVGDASSPSISIGNDWSGIPHDGYPPVTDVTLDNIKFKDCGYLLVWEGKRLVMRNMTMENVASASGWWAIDMRSQTGGSGQTTWSELDVLIENVAVIGCDYGGVSFKVPTRAIVRGLRISGCNAVGSGVALNIATLENRSGAFVSLEGLDIDGGVTIQGDSSAGSAYTVRWGANNRVTGTLTLLGDAHNFIYGKTHTVSVGDIAATGTVSRILYCASRRCYIPRASLLVSADVAADGTNYRQFAAKSKTAALGTTTIASNTTIAGLTAFTTKTFGFAVSETGAYLEPGDTLYVEFTSAGTGKALTGASVRFEVLDY